MKLLKCKLCRGEVDIINNHKGVNKIIKCRKCGYSNNRIKHKKSTEVVIIKK
jgi:hypothetical protein